MTNPFEKKDAQIEPTLNTLDEEETVEDNEAEEEGKEEDAQFWKEQAEHRKNKFGASSKEAQYLQRRQKVLDDPQEFIKLAKSDKKMAERIAQSYGMTADEAMRSLTPQTDNQTSDIEEVLDRRDAQKELNQFLSTQKIENSSDFHKDFMEEFNFLMEGKKRTPEIVKKIQKTAFNNVKKTSEHYENYQKNKEDLSGAGVAMGGGGKTSKPSAPQVITLDNYYKARKNQGINF